MRKKRAEAPAKKTAISLLPAAHPSNVRISCFVYFPNLEHLTVEMCSVSDYGKIIDRLVTFGAGGLKA